MQEPEQKVADWGKQTIIFAMNTRALDLGKSTDDPNHINTVAREADQLAGQFWEESFNEAPKPAHFFATKSRGGRADRLGANALRLIKLTSTVFSAAIHRG